MCIRDKLTTTLVSKLYHYSALLLQKCLVFHAENFGPRKIQVRPWKVFKNFFLSLVDRLTSVKWVINLVVVFPQWLWRRIQWQKNVRKISSVYKRNACFYSHLQHTVHYRITIIPAELETDQIVPHSIRNSRHSVKCTMHACRPQGLLFICGLVVFFRLLSAAFIYLISVV